jgi:hypothetical protein
MRKNTSDFLPPPVESKVTAFLYDEGAWTPVSLKLSPTVEEGLKNSGCKEMKRIPCLLGIGTLYSCPNERQVFNFAYVLKMGKSYIEYYIITTRDLPNLFRLLREIGATGNIEVNDIGNHMERMESMLADEFPLLRMSIDSLADELKKKKNG